MHSVYRVRITSNPRRSLSSTAYQRVLVAKTLQRSAAIRTDSSVVRDVLDNYNKSITVDKHTLIGIEEAEANFHRDLLEKCAYINGPELDAIAKEMDKAKTYSIISFLSFSTALASMMSAFVFDVAIALFLIAPTFYVCYFVFIVKSDILQNRAVKKVELLRGFERRIVEVPNTEEMLELLSNSAKE